MSKPLTKHQIAAMLTAADEGFADEQKEMLSADLRRTDVKTREQAGLQLSYVEGWHVNAEANRIFGFDGWACETVTLQAVHAGAATVERWKKGERGVKEKVEVYNVTYMAKVRVTVYAGSRVLVREGTGAGHGLSYRSHMGVLDIGGAHESASKEAETDAFKRAIKTFGNVFGLALYDKQQRNVSDGAEDTPAAKPAAKKTPEAGAANVAAVAQPSVAAAPAPVADDPAAKEAANCPLLVGDGKGKDGLHVLCRKALLVNQRAAQYTTRALKSAATKLDTAKAAWDAWHQSAADITPAQEAKIEEALDYYERERLTLAASIEGADPNAGELPSEQEAA